MKLRIRGDSIRLRLTRSEVATAAAAGVVREQTRFSEVMHFEYRFAADPDVARLCAVLEQGALVVRAPRALVESWANSHDVALESWQANGADGSLRILVEKDFPCLTARPHEDDSDAFNGPLAVEGANCGAS